MVEFVELCKEKYMKAAMEPGTAVGALCAQVIIFNYCDLRLRLFLAIFSKLKGGNSHANFLQNSRKIS